MNKKVHFIVALIIFFFSTFNLFSQGGDNAAAAFAAPVTLPFSAAGTTCGHVDDYNPLQPYAISPDGKDWVYYFCAPTAGVIDLFTSNYYGPSPAIMVYSVTPNVIGNNWFATNFTGATSMYSTVSITVTAGSCYYVMIDSWNNTGFPATCFNYSLNMQYHVNPPVAPLQPACTNIGYDAGNLGGWIGTYGAVTQGTVGAATPAYTPLYYTTTAAQHSVTSGAGTDIYGGFPIVNPLGGGTNSLRLGDVGTFGDIGQYFGGIPGNGGATLEQKFTVTPSNALFIYYYAVVLQDAGIDHTNPEQPFFKTDVYDCLGAPITCGQYLVTGGPGIPGFTLSGSGSNVYWKNWSPVAVDLTPYIGTCVTVKYTVGDCTRGAHFAYAYIDAVCLPLAITGVNIICPTKSTTLTAPNGLFSYSWTPGGATTQSVVVSPTVTTTYTCELTSYASCKTFLTYSVSLYPQAVASAISQTICNGTAANITTTVSPAGGTYSWTPGGSTLSTLSISPSITTSYTCTYTDLNGCKDTALSKVTVNPLPVMVVPPNVAICNSAIVAASSFTSNLAGTTFSWSNTNTSIGLGLSGTSNTPSFTATNGGSSPITSVISVTPTSINGCVGLPITYTITVNPIPTVNAVPSATYCNGVLIPLTTFTGNISTSTYSWSNTNAGIGIGVSGTGNIASFNGTNLGLTPITGVLTVTPTAFTCVGLPTTFSITVNPLPIVTVPTSTNYCNGGIVPAQTFSSNIVSTTYSWTNTNPSIGLGSSGSGNIASFSSVNLGLLPVVGVISVTPTVNGCVGLPASFSITVNPDPLAPTVSNVTICPTSNATLTATAPGGTYNWYNAPVAGTLLISNPSYITPSLTVTTLYYVNATNASGCISPLTTVTVTVLNSLVINAGSNQTICIGANASLSVSPSGVGYLYSWDSPGSPGFSSIANPLVTPTITTNYSVTVTSPSGCIGTDQILVQVNPLPTANVGLPIAFCSGQSGIIGAAAVGGYSYAWSPGTGLSSPLISNPTVILTNATALPIISNYSLTVTLNGCQATNTVQVTVNPIPVSNAGLPLTICNGQMGAIGTTSVAGYNYSWSPPTNLSSSTVSNPIVTGVNPGAGILNVLYTVTTTATLTTCQSTNSVVVSVLPVATVGVNAVPSSCEGALNIPISGFVGGSSSTGVWSGGLGSITPGIPTTNALYTPSASEFAAGSATLTLTAIATAPCPNVQSTLVISFYKNPVVNYTVDIPKGCPEHCVVFNDLSTILAPEFIQQWSWNFGDGSSSAIQNPSHCYPNTGLYTVSLEVTSNHLCASKVTITNMIEVYPMPIASFVPSPLSAGIFDPTINFQNTSQGAVSYFWDFGDYAALGSTNTSILTDPSHLYTYANTYNVNLVATSIHGCVDVASINVEIKPEFTFYIPNCFSPGDDDGINDIFTGMGIGIEKYEMWIFDRWGVNIFYTDDIYKGWNGKVQGKSKGVQQDVYVWKVKLKDVFGLKHEYIGHVTLLN